MDLKLALDDVRQDIARLKKVEQSLLEALGVPTGQPAEHQKGSTRVSAAGSKVISLRARKRHLDEKIARNGTNPTLQAELKQVEAELKQAKNALDADRKSRGLRVRS